MMKKRVIAVSMAAVLALAGSLGVAASEKKAGGYSYVDAAGKIDLPAYFTAEGASATMQDESIDFVMSGEEASVTFNKPLASDSLGVSFAGVPESTLKKVEIILTDIENPEEKASIVFSSMSAASSLVQLGGTKRAYIIEGSFFKQNNYDFYVSYNAEYRNFSDGLTYNIPVLESLEGIIFPGFSSHKVNLTIRLTGEDGSVFRLKEINRQRMGRLYTEDTETPGITIVNPVKKAVINSTITLPQAFAMDVLADNATVTMSVVDPDGEEVKAVDGTKLTDVTPNKDYKIKIEKGGTYRLSFAATDGENKTRPMSNAIVVTDSQGPKIELSESIPVATKAGETLKFPEITYTDNISEGDTIASWVTVKYPSGVVFEAEKSVELTEEGLYEITFLAMDEIGNISRVTAQTYAEGE